jgi:iron complex outermembrane receptor protein
LAAALALPALLTPSGVLAQDGASETADPSAPGTEIVVTAQFREQNVQSIPIAITAVSGEQLEARGQTSIVDIASKAPSVLLAEANQQGPSLIAYIRGIGQGDHSPAFEPGVGLYVDDVYFATLTGSLMDLLDLERVEVLRGPQGTLAGMNSIGGAIKLYSQKPNGNGGGFVETTIGSYDRLDVRASANFTVVPDTLYARISGVSRNQDGYVTRYDFACTHPQEAATYNIPTHVENAGDCKLGTEGGKSYVAARGALRFLPSDNLEINISGDITRDRSEAKPQTLIYVGRGNSTTYQPGLNDLNGALNLSRFYPMYTTARENGLDFWNPVTQTSPFLSYSPWGGAGDTFTTSPYVTYSNYADVLPPDGGPGYAYDPRTTFNGWGVSGNIEYDLSDDVKVTSITAYRQYDASWVQDFDMTMLSNAIFSYESESWQFSQEARVAVNLFDGDVDLVLGGFYLDRSTNYRANVNQGLLTFAEYDEVPATNWALFANASWRLTDRLELNAGLRYSEDEKTFRFFRFGRPGIPTNPPVPPYFPCTVNGVNYGNVHVAFCGLNGMEGTYKGDNIDYRAVLQYQWTPDIMTYASIATGYKGGGVNPRPYTANQAVPFGNEMLTAYELGAKTNLFNRRARVNVSAFVNKYSDFIAGVFSRVPVGTRNESCYFAPQDDTCSYLVNAGDATLKGIEAELTLEPVDRLVIDAAASLLDFQYDKLSGCSPALDASCTSPFGGLGAGLRYGMQLARSPDRQFSAGVQYAFEIGNAGTLTPRVDVSYQSGYDTDAVNKVLAYVPEFTLVNARLAWTSADEDWQVALLVSNLTNELYYTNVAPQDNSASVAGNPGSPRQWSLSVKRSF